MYSANLSVRDSDTEVSITTPDVVVNIKYLNRQLALTAYLWINECCTRFSLEPSLTPLVAPRIYVFGEMHTWQQYIKRLTSIARKIGAIVTIKGHDNGI